MRSALMGVVIRLSVWAEPQPEGQPPSSQLLHRLKIDRCASNLQANSQNAAERRVHTSWRMMHDTQSR